MNTHRPPTRLVVIHCAREPLHLATYIGRDLHARFVCPASELTQEAINYARTYVKPVQMPTAPEAA